MSLIKKSIKEVSIQQSKVSIVQPLIVSYTPLHPLLAYKTTSTNTKIDHLSAYTEHNPFTPSEMSKKEKERRRRLALEADADGEEDEAAEKERRRRLAVEAKADAKK